jgi:hypothetical protein
LAAIGGIAAIVAAALTLLWIAVMAIGPSPPERDGAAGELRFIARHGAAQVPRFAPTTLVAFAYVPMWLGLASVLWQEQPAAAALTLAFGLLYVPLVAVGYWVQFTAVRALAEFGDSEAVRAVYEVAGFHDRRTSATGSLVVLGYTVWSLAGVAAAVGLLAAGDTTARVAGSLYLLTAVLMLGGTVGFVARIRVLARGVLLSGVASVASTIATAVLLLAAMPPPG